MELKPCKTGNYKHGYSVTHPKLFGVWESMRSRCNNPNRDKYKDYGARGIHVCDEWQMSAEAFCKWAIENGYRDGLQIDRIDNEKGYSPDNCRWVTPKQNSRNRRNTVTLCVNGVTKSVAEWCETIDISPFTVYWWVKSKGEKYAETRLSELARMPVLRQRSSDADGDDSDGEETAIPGDLPDVQGLYGLGFLEARRCR